MTPADREEERAPVRLWMQGRRVLVLEDEYFLADELRRFLVDAGAEVVGPVPGIEEAFALLASQPIDCAVLDINLHGETVFPLARVLRARNLPWIYVTGYASPAIPPDLEGAAYIEKPITKSAFMNAMDWLV